MTEKKLNILLVDDEKKFLDTISDRIRLKGFEPLLATSGKEALEIARKHKIHAAVVDLKMPDMDGLVTITKLKEIHPKIKTVLLTGFGDEKVKEAAEAVDTARPSTRPILKKTGWEIFGILLRASKETLKTPWPLREWPAGVIWKMRLKSGKRTKNIN
jgi:CheY-like chemotaxis protein